MKLYMALGSRAFKEALRGFCLLAANLSFLVATGSAGADLVTSAG